MGDVVKEDCVRVFLHNCQVDLRVGIYAEEMKAPQPVLANVEIDTNLAYHYENLAENSLERVVSYEEVYNFICHDLTQMGHIGLLETVAEQIIDFCFRDIRVSRVCVRLEKTKIFASAAGAGVVINRVRPRS